MPDPATPTPGLPASPGMSQAPVGVAPATQATPNRGYEMAGLQGLAVVLKNLEALVPRLGATSEAGADVLKAIRLISKHVQPGSVSPAAQRNELMSQMQRMQQGAAQLNQMRQMARPAGPPPGAVPGPAAVPQPAAA